MSQIRGGIMFNQRDIVLIPFPYSDLTLSEKRPALIISNEKMNKMQDRICCLITTKPHKDDLLIEKDSFENGTFAFQEFYQTSQNFYNS